TEPVTIPNTKPRTRLLISSTAWSRWSCSWSMDDSHKFELSLLTLGLHSRRNSRLCNSQLLEIVELLAIPSELFMIIFIHINRPQIVIGPSDIPRGKHCCQHRMILIIVLVHPVSSD